MPLLVVAQRLSTHSYGNMWGSFGETIEVGKEKAISMKRVKIIRKVAMEGL